MTVLLFELAVAAAIAAATASRETAALAALVVGFGLSFGTLDLAITSGISWDDIFFLDLSWESLDARASAKGSVFDLGFFTVDDGTDDGTFVGLSDGCTAFADGLTVFADGFIEDGPEDGPEDDLVGGLSGGFTADDILSLLPFTMALRGGGTRDGLPWT